jgi:hypothetical protein
MADSPMFRRYAIVSSGDQKSAMEMLDKARAAITTHSAPISPVSEENGLARAETITRKVQ